MRQNKEPQDGTMNQEIKDLLYFTADEFSEEQRRSNVEELKELLIDVLTEEIEELLDLMIEEFSEEQRISYKEEIEELLEEN